MPYGPTILALAIASFVAWVFIVIHAFSRSVGTGFLVLLIPAYVVYYAFSQFEHERKGVIVAVFVGCGLLSGMLYGALVATLPAQMSPIP